ncbi:MAG: hypothetical protein DRR08_19140 [Candidatus Parabeggiatoa sp. nov. 2]|nr:MAG: hypothetical protein B6247_22565 [Beggiatoa sp. 4572_84]RKZ57396.1 MAG: hypothetical protein DRR08_19140 [Gammaproteobacteria bacterium]
MQGKLGTKWFVQGKLGTNYDETGVQGLPCLLHTVDIFGCVPLVLLKFFQSRAINQIKFHNMALKRQFDKTLVFW